MTSGKRNTVQGGKEAESKCSKQSKWNLVRRKLPEIIQYGRDQKSKQSKWIVVRLKLSEIVQYGRRNNITKASKWNFLQNDDSKQAFWNLVRLVRDLHNKEKNEQSTLNSSTSSNDDMNKKLVNMCLSHLGRRDSVHPNHVAKLEVDVRNLPIIINQYDDEYDQMMSIAKLMEKLNRKISAFDHEEEQYRRQEHNLRAFTRYYDPQSGEYTSCDKPKTWKWSNCTSNMYNEAWETRYRRRKRCAIM